jgi:hypothetical protein
LSSQLRGSVLSLLPSLPSQGVADIAATLYATSGMVAPYRLNDRFVAAFPGFKVRSFPSASGRFSERALSFGLAFFV